MRITSVFSLATLAAALVSARADERFFTYVYESDVLPKGKWEFEQWLTYGQGYPGGDREYSSHTWSFREEMEYGLTERLSGSLYLNFQSQQFVAREEGLQNESDFSFEGVSAEFKYQLLNPNTKPVGIALYLEPTYNGDEIELEEKLLFSKTFNDKWVTALNFSFEQEWEQEEGTTEKESIFEVTTGVAYRFTPHWSAGIEGRYRSVYEGLGFNEHLATGWYVGPNVHYGSSKWWGTLTVLPQVAGHPSDGGLNYTENEKFEVRLIFGINF